MINISNHIGIKKPDPMATDFAQNIRTILDNRKDNIQLKMVERDKRKKKWTQNKIENLKNNDMNSIKHYKILIN